MPPPRPSSPPAAGTPARPDAALLRAARAKARSLGLNPIGAYINEDGRIVFVPGTKCDMRDGKWMLTPNDLLVNVGRAPMPAGDTILWAGQCAVLKDGKITRLTGRKPKPKPKPVPTDWPTRYKWKSKWSLPSVAAGVCVREVEVAGGKRAVRIRRAEPGKGRVPAMGGRAIVDLPGSRDLRIEVDPAVKVTHFVGLAFTTPCILSIDTDGTIISDTPGIVAPDARGTVWRSRTVGADPARNAFFPVKLARPRSTTRPSGPLARSKAPSKSAPAKPPRFARPLNGPDLVRVRNPNTFRVLVALRSGSGGKDFVVGAGGVTTVHVPDGRYDIYFIYSNQPEALYKGDSFTLRGNGVEIKIVKVVGGNFGIRRVK